VFQELRGEFDLSKLRMLHVAPEPFFEARLRPLCTSYVTADISREGVDRKEDLTRLSFPDASFDIVYASHVLEHIQDDVRAINEIRRVLSPNGLAILPVPIFGASTIEYGAPNRYEVDHVRSPGIAYFDRYRAVFSRVEVFDSSCFDERFQVCIHEDRSRWPASMPNRPTMMGSVHPDYIPVCYVS
jgi:SAM-dependent methyltransferase